MYDSVAHTFLFLSFYLGPSLFLSSASHFPLFSFGFAGSLSLRCLPSCPLSRSPPPHTTARLSHPFVRPTSGIVDTSIVIISRHHIPRAHIVSYPRPPPERERETLRVATSSPRGPWQAPPSTATAQREHKKSMNLAVSASTQDEHRGEEDLQAKTLLQSDGKRADSQRASGVDEGTRKARTGPLDSASDSQMCER